MAMGFENETRGEGCESSIAVSIGGATWPIDRNPKRSIALHVVFTCELMDQGWLSLTATQ